MVAQNIRFVVDRTADRLEKRAVDGMFRQSRVVVGRLWAAAIAPCDPQFRKQAKTFDVFDFDAHFFARLVFDADFFFCADFLTVAFGLSTKMDGFLGDLPALISVK